MHVVFNLMHYSSQWLSSLNSSLLIELLYHVHCIYYHYLSTYSKRSSHHYYYDPITFMYRINLLWEVYCPRMCVHHIYRCFLDWGVSHSFLIWTERDSLQSVILFQWEYLLNPAWFGQSFLDSRFVAWN